MLSHEAKAFCRILSKTLSRDINWDVQYDNTTIINATGFTSQSSLRYHYVRQHTLGNDQITHYFIRITNGIKMEKIGFTTDATEEEYPSDLILFRLFTKWEQLVTSISNAEQFLSAVDPSFDKP